MTLSTLPSSTGRRIAVNVHGTDLCAVVCALSAGVHAALVRPHAAESTLLAGAFALVTVGLAGAAYVQAVAPTAVTSTAVATLLVSVAVAYLLSRTTGLPGLTVHTEPFDALGTVTSCAEVVAALVVARHTHHRRNS